jgi:hypothetical protein
MFFNKILAIVLAACVASTFATEKPLPPLVAKGHINLPNQPPCFVEVKGSKDTVYINPAITFKVFKADKETVMFLGEGGPHYVTTSDPEGLIAKFFKDVREQCK